MASSVSSLRRRRTASLTRSSASSSSKASLARPSSSSKSSLAWSSSPLEDMPSSKDSLSKHARLPASRRVGTNLAPLTLGEFSSAHCNMRPQRPTRGRRGYFQRTTPHYETRVRRRNCEFSRGTVGSAGTRQPAAATRGWDLTACRLTFLRRRNVLSGGT
eukprot:scaffold1964_cov61-Phaeocystis_antarctica.AAC.2